jgi:hypothetical protein
MVIEKTLAFFNLTNDQFKEGVDTFKSDKDVVEAFKFLHLDEKQILVAEG